MSGATGGAGAGRRRAAGPAARETTRGSIPDSRPGAAPGSQGGQPGYDPYAAGPLPTERPISQQPAQPYHPPQAYAPPTSSGGRHGGGTAEAGHAPAPSGTQQSVRRSRGGAAAPAASRTAPRTRKARLRVAKTDPWSVMKVSFLLSIALGICTVIASALLWMVMDAMGVFSTVGDTISEATESNEGSGFDLESFLSMPRVMAITSVIAVINVVLMTALATLGSFIYNLSAGFVGGVEVTLAEDE